MSQSPADIPDKIIVDRRKSYRNSDVRKAVRKTRDRLAEQGVSDPGFDSELLTFYARSLVNGTLAIAMLVVVVAFAALAFGMGLNIVVWAAATVILYAGSWMVGRRYLATSPRSRDPFRWARYFLVIQATLGLCWAWFAVSPCTACTGSDILFFKAISLLVAMAATTTLGYNLRWSLVTSFALPVLAFAVVNDALFAPRASVAAGLLLGALLFFSFIGMRLNRASLASLSFRSENDSLIAELEMARSISEEARRRAEDANLAKSRFLASMSHELRTPLNAILGFSEVMTNEVLGPMENENYRSYAQDIHDSGRHLLKLINEILDLSRIEAGKQDLQEEPLRLSDIAEDCIGLVKMKAGQKNIRIEHTYEGNMPRLFADERSIRQVMLNLLSNAVKFTPSGGLIQVKTGWTVSGGQYVSVRDNGPGIAEDEIPIVLSAFGQGAIAIKSAEQGTGLGLPIVQALMAMHGGVFKLRSKLRDGTEALAIFPPSRVMDEMPAEPVRDRSARRAERRGRASEGLVGAAVAR